MATPRLSPRLFDQRFDERLDLFAVEQQPVIGNCTRRRRRGITVSGTPERGAVMQRVRELVEFARGQGYAVDELVEMIEDIA